MNEKILFRNQVNQRLSQLNPDVLRWNEDEFWMVQFPYETLEYYAIDHRLMNTAMALPLARGLHNGSHRKSSITRGGVAYRLPYVIHCLIVCRMLVDLHLPLSADEEDIVLAAALCHDMVEDIPFPNHGEELTEEFGLDPRVLETVKLVSKQKDFTSEQEQAHFHAIESNKLSLLVKLSDRSHNVEDLYNMSTWKVHEYIGETRKYFLPMCAYGMEHYPELATCIEILRDKIVSLTQAAEIMVDRCEAWEQELREQLQALQEENRQLQAQCRALWEGRA